jgi:hypothetical protein
VPNVVVRAEPARVDHAGSEVIDAVHVGDRPSDSTSIRLGDRGILEPVAFVAVLSWAVAVGHRRGLHGSTTVGYYPFRRVSQYETDAT